MDRFLVVTPEGLERVARVSQEIVMTSRGYAQPGTVNLAGKRVKGHVHTSQACRDALGRHPWFPATP